MGSVVKQYPAIAPPSPSHNHEHNWELHGFAPQYYEVSFPSDQVLFVALECVFLYICYVRCVISSRVLYLSVQFSHLTEAGLDS